MRRNRVPILTILTAVAFSIPLGNLYIVLVAVGSLSVPQAYSITTVLLTVEGLMFGASFLLEKASHRLAALFVAMITLAFSLYAVVLFGTALQYPSKLNLTSTIPFAVLPYLAIDVPLTLLFLTDVVLFVLTLVAYYANIVFVFENKPKFELDKDSKSIV